MISLGEKVTDTAYVTGFLRGFFFVCLFGLFCNGKK